MPDKPLLEFEDAVQLLALDSLVEAEIEWQKEPTDIAEVDARVDALLYAIGKLQKEAMKNSEVAHARHEQITRWLADEGAHIERSIGYLTQKIQDLTRSYDFGRKKSRRLPAGTFGYRRNAERLEIVDRAVALRFSREFGVAVRVSDSPDVGALLEYMKTTGEIPDGTFFKEGTESFFVKPKADEDDPR